MNYESTTFLFRNGTDDYTLFASGVTNRQMSGVCSQK